MALSKQKADACRNTKLCLPKLISFCKQRKKLTSIKYPSLNGDQFHRSNHQTVPNKSKIIIIIFFHSTSRRFQSKKLMHAETQKFLGIISWVTNYSLILARNFNVNLKLPWQRFVPRWRSRFKDVIDEFTSS